MSISERTRHDIVAALHCQHIHCICVISLIFMHNQPLIILDIFTVGLINVKLYCLMIGLQFNDWITGLQPNILLPIYNVIHNTLQ